MENLDVALVRNSLTYQIYEVRFYESVIVTTVTSEVSRADRWVNQRKNGVVAISAKYSRITSAPAIIQICCRHRCLIFQVQACGFIPASIQLLINNPNNTVVGVTIQSIIDILQSRYELVVNPGVKLFDLRDLVPGATKTWRIEKISSHLLHRHYITPKKINKRWGKGLLSPRQVLFAAVDSHATYLAASLLMAEQNA